MKIKKCVTSIKQGTHQFNHCLGENGKLKMKMEVGVVFVVCGEGVGFIFWDGVRIKI